MKQEPPDTNAIAAWLAQAKGEGWKHPDVLINALQEDASLVRHFAYCRKCHKAMADMVAVIGVFNDDDPQFEGARDGEIEPGSHMAMCSECIDEDLQSSAQDHE